MAAFAVVQGAVPTVAGTVDFTSPDIVNPKAAIFFGTRAQANGTAIPHAMLFVGATDGTNHRAIVGRSESAIVLGTTDSTHDDSLTQCVITSQTAVSTRNTEGTFDSWLTNGVRLNFGLVPGGILYKVNCILIGGSEVSNVYVGNAATDATVDVAVDVTAPGFQPDVVLTFTNCSTLDDIVGSNFAWSLGMVVRDGSNTQRSLSINENTAVGTTAVITMLDTNSVARRAASGAGGSEAQISNFDASGFDLVHKVAGASIDVCYVAIKLNGVSAKVLTSASPVATGADTIAGAGFTPGFGLMFHSSCVAVDTVYSDGNAEVFGISAFTTAASASAATAIDDNIAAGGGNQTITESITNYGATTSGVPVSLRKDSLEFMTATFTAFTSDGVTFNYSAVDPATTARQRAVLFIQSGAITYPGPIAMQQVGGVMIGRRYV